METIALTWRLLSAQEKFTISVLAAFRAGLNVLDVLGLALIALLGSIASGAPLPEFLPENLRSFAMPELVAFGLATMAGLFITKSIGSLLVSKRLLNALARIETNRSVTLAHLLFEPDLVQFKSRSTGDAEWQILRSTYVAFLLVPYQTTILVSEATLSFTIVVIFFLTDPVMALSVLIYFSVIAAIFHFASRAQLSKAGETFTKRTIDTQETIQDINRAFLELSVQNRTQVLLQKLSKFRGPVATSHASMLHLEAVPRVILELALILGVVVFGGWSLLMNSGEIDLAFVGVFLVGSFRMMTSLLPLQRSIMSLRFYAGQASASQHALYSSKSSPKIREVDENFEESLDGASASGGPLALEVDVRDVSFNHDDTQRSSGGLYDISLSFQRGSITGIIGPSGSGKSTLLNLITGLLVPTKGEVLVEGKPANLIRHEPRLRVSYVPQKPGLLSDTIKANILFGSEEDLDQELTWFWEVLDSVGLRDFVHSLPDKENTNLGKHADNLSGGQLQRVGIARAIFARPQLLILDEATSALDDAAEAKVMKVISQLSNTCTVLVVSHKKSILDYVQEVIIIEAGQLVRTLTAADFTREVASLSRFFDESP